MNTLKMNVVNSTYSLMGALQGFSETEIADQICGTYWSPNKDGKIAIYKKGEQYFGRTIWLKTSAAACKNQVAGAEFLSDFTYAGGIYIGGSFHAPENGGAYRCKMILDGDKLKVRVYVGILLFGRTAIFERITKNN